MDARARTIGDIFRAADQYLVPFFQRQYAWTPKHWERLRDDIWALLDDATSSKHFIGPLVCTPTEHAPGKIPAYQLIDGQQRLTTLTVMLAALRDVAVTQGLPELAEDIKNDYLVHKRKTGIERYKVIPRLGDRDALMALVEGNESKLYRRLGVYRAWSYYQKEIATLTEKSGDASLHKLFATILERLSLVVITIEGENPYEIFESLNSTGLPLEESDLVRNYLFMQVPLSEQERFNIAYWQPFERMFAEVNDYPALNPTSFYRSYLMRDGVYSKARATFVDFKDQYKRAKYTPKDQVEELKRFAQYELMLHRSQVAENSRLRSLLAQIFMLEVTTAHPLLMRLMGMHERGSLDEANLLGCMEDLASFVLRRSICGESTRTYGRWFVEAVLEVGENPRENLRQYWLKRGWPDDKTFTSRLVHFALYRRETKKCRLILLKSAEFSRVFGRPRLAARDHRSTSR
ncbi:MAG: DUF262 domain-containing protein [Betaproteobacteria bacterium]|nr:DUF262 domain-containing protein [Betaproteobacteria bacterium]